MRNVTLALCCFFVSIPMVAQQPAASSKPATSPAASTAPQTPPPPAHPLTDFQAKEILELTGASKIKQQLTEGMTNYFSHSMPFVPKDVMDDLQQSLGKLDVETPAIADLKQRISEEDARSIIAFYKTPAGKTMIDTVPSILRESEQAGVQMARKTAQDVVTRHRPEIEAAAKQYQQEHAPKPTPSLNTPAAPSAPATTTPPSK